MQFQSWQISRKLFCTSLLWANHATVTWTTWGTENFNSKNCNDHNRSFILARIENMLKTFTSFRQSVTCWPALLPEATQGSHFELSPSTLHAVRGYTIFHDLVDTHSKIAVSSDTWGICTRRKGKLYQARSRLYRSKQARSCQIWKINTRWKALAEIYIMHSFAPFSNFKIFVKNCWIFFWF